MDEYRKSNLELWNNWAEINAASEMYNVEAFKKGKSSLNSLEIEEVGDVAGKSLLHLQCHFGKDTLAWARMGATATGADFSDRAIEIARELAVEIGVPATFVLSDLYNLPNALTGEFDIVFTSYGALSWLPDINEWARVVAHFLKPGGMFYVAEFHPFAYVFENAESGDGLRVAYPYESLPNNPLRFETQGTYADQAADYKGVEYGWNHPLGDIVTALTEAGLRIEFLHEQHFSADGSMFRGFERGEDGYYRLKDPVLREAIPLMFSIKAWK